MMKSLLEDFLKKDLCLLNIFQQCFFQNNKKLNLKEELNRIKFKLPFIFKLNEKTFFVVEWEFRQTCLINNNSVVSTRWCKKSLM